MSLSSKNAQLTMPFTAQTPSMADPMPTRRVLIARWTDLVKVILPGMARECGWSLSQDHCFMRVCLDTAVGAPWHQHVQRPAIKHLTDAELAAAVAVAEGIVRTPHTLDALTRRSIEQRKIPLKLNYSGRHATD